MLLFYVDDLVAQDPHQILPQLQRISRQGSRSSSTEEDKINDDSEPCLLLWHQLVTTEAHLYYGPYSSGIIQKGFTEFVLGSIIEARFPRGLRGPGVPFTAARLLRDKAGAGEVYAHFLFPTDIAPETIYLEKYFVHAREMMDFVNFTNDIMSFYKEHVILVEDLGEQEENTYIMNRARCEGKDALTVLRDLCSEVVGLEESVRKGFKGQGILEDVWEEYVNGYILFHASDERYRLGELGFVFARDGHDAPAKEGNCQIDGKHDSEEM